MKNKIISNEINEGKGLTLLSDPFATKFNFFVDKISLERDAFCPSEITKLFVFPTESTRLDIVIDDSFSDGLSKIISAFPVSPLNSLIKIFIDTISNFVILGNIKVISEFSVKS